MVAVGGAGAPKAPPAPKMPAFPAFPTAPKAAPVKEAPAIKTDEKAAEPAPGTKPTSREGEAEGDDATAAKSGAETPEATPGKELARDRYRVILVRNPFGLNPPPPPVVETAPEPEPEPDLTIYLTGITTLLGTKKAFLKTDDPKETDKLKKFRYYTLKEGEARDGLEVVSIDVETGSVKINHKSASRTLNLEDDGIEAVAAPVSAPGKPGGAKLPPGMSCGGDGASGFPADDDENNHAPSGEFVHSNCYRQCERERPSDEHQHTGAKPAFHRDQRAKSQRGENGQSSDSTDPQQRRALVAAAAQGGPSGAENPDGVESGGESPRAGTGRPDHAAASAHRPVTLLRAGWRQGALADGAGRSHS